MAVPWDQLRLILGTVVRIRSGPYCLISFNHNIIWYLGVQAQTTVLVRIVKELIYSF